MNILLLKSSRRFNLVKPFYKRFCANAELNQHTISDTDKSEIPQTTSSNENTPKLTENRDFSNRLLDYFINPNRYTYFDKSDILSKFVEDNYTDIIIKPPNYGKTFSLNLLKYFLSNNLTNNNIFFESKKGFNSSITSLKNFYSNYKVIKLNLSELESASYESNLDLLREQILSNYDQILPLVNENSFSDIERQQFSQLIEKLNNSNCNKEILLNSVKNLSKYLFRLTGKHCFLLVDDYDAPLINASKYDYYEKMLNFLKEFFAVSVKSNEYLYKTIITSTTPTEINTIFANYKNLYIHSTDKDDKYEENLGISEEEINNILNEDTSMNLLKTHYSSLNEETKKSWTFTEVINSIKNETSLNKDLNELNIKEILIKLSNEHSENNSNIKLLCQLCLRSLQIVNSDSNSNLISGNLLDNLSLSTFDSKVGFSLLYYYGLLRKTNNKENDNLYDIRNYSTAEHLLENIPKESEYSNYQTRFILNYFLNLNYNRVDNKPNLKGFLDYLKSLSVKRVKSKADFPTFKSEKELKNFFIKIFAFDPDYFTIVNTLESPITSNLQAVVSIEGDFAILFDCKKITRTNKPLVDDKNKLINSLKTSTNTGSPGNTQPNPFESDSEVRPEIMNELKTITEETFKNINSGGAVKMITTKYPVTHIFVLVLSNYQKQFEYKLEVISQPSNN